MRWEHGWCSLVLAVGLFAGSDGHAPTPAGSRFAGVWDCRWTTRTPSVGLRCARAARQRGAQQLRFLLPALWRFQISVPSIPGRWRAMAISDFSIAPARRSSNFRAADCAGVHRQRPQGGVYRLAAPQAACRKKRTPGENRAVPVPHKRAAPSSRQAMSPRRPPGAIPSCAMAARTRGAC